MNGDMSEESLARRAFGKATKRQVDRRSCRQPSGGSGARKFEPDAPMGLVDEGDLSAELGFPMRDILRRQRCVADHIPSSWTRRSNGA